MIIFVPNEKFISVAISLCKLNCKHCTGAYLKQMMHINRPEKFIRFGSNYAGNGILVSGGFDTQGKLINLTKMIPAVKKLKDKFYMAVHPGFVDQQLAEEIADAFHIAFVDIPSPDAIFDIFGLQATVEDYMDSIENLLDSGIKVTPHITLGLQYGIVNEYKVLEYIKQFNFEKLVVNTILPTAGTEFQEIRINKADVINFITTLQQLNIYFSIGCMRPRYLDTDFIDIGVSELTNPSKDAILYAQQKGIHLERLEWCCGINKKDIENWMVDHNK
jgi:uncharacterized radical SAM superfamily protein